MLKLCRHNQDEVIEKLKNNKFDNVAMSRSNFVDDIILKMYDDGILNCLTSSIKDKRADNTVIPFNLVMSLAVAAKMKVHSSVSDIPFAITDHRVLAKLGYNLIDTDGDMKRGLMSESSLRFLLKKYTAEELFNGYNDTVQKHIMPKLDMVPDIHILDCTEISVNLDNSNYENSAFTTNKYGDKDRGYKLATLRGLVDDTGVIEHIVFGPMNTHDLTLSKDMLFTTDTFKSGDILIEDRGFLDRETINYLKTERGVDTFVPLKSNMIAYQTAVTAAQSENIWEAHPSRKNQKIAFVTELGTLWQSDKPKEDVDFNAAVVWDVENNGYYVFVTTDLSKSAKQILLTYELRPEIEEDYRQLKDFWELESFKSTKYNMIAFHIITVLFGYFFFQIYTATPDGERFAHKCLPVILKNYQTVDFPYFIFYADDEFAILSIMQFYELLPHCNSLAYKRLRNLLEKNSS